MLDDDEGGLISRSLLNAKAPPSDATYGQWGPTPLIAALEAEQFENASQLLMWGADPRISDRTGTDGFYWACNMLKCSSGNDHWAQKILPYMIDKHPKLIHCKIGDGYINGGTALMCAARFGLQHAVAYLLSRGSDGTIRYEGGDDDGRSACVIARKNGWREVSKMLRVFTMDDWRDWEGEDGLPGEANWLRLAGRSALGRKVRVTADNFQIVDGIIDDFDPMRGMHHVNFQMSNAAGSWEGWFLLDRQNCQLLTGQDIGSTIPSPPKRSGGSSSNVKNRRPPLSIDQGVSWAGFGGIAKDEKMLYDALGESSYEQASKPSFQRSAVKDAFQRQARGMGEI
tara:strand:- start:86 stop:1108 length:1023 start_codon:yes stop_codon:yes gene_type:complete